MGRFVQRYYDPAIGRFLSVDPVTAYEKPMTNFNRYVYALNNPYKFTDPDGRDVVCTATSCTGTCHSGVECMGDYLHVGVVYLGRLIQNATDNLQRTESGSQSDAKPEPGTAESDEGCIYCVPGEATESGRDYVGSADDLDRRAATANDGRDRSKAEKIDSYPKGDRKTRQEMEQQAMNDRGGKDKLDNKRDEIRRDRWEDRGVRPPRSER